VKLLEIDNSAIQAYRRCPQYFFNYYVQGLRTNNDELTAAGKGNLIHTALEQYYGNEEVKPTGHNDLDLIVNKYMECWPKETDYFEVIYPEIKFRVPSPYHSNVFIVGSIDVLAKHKDTGRYLIIDHKTTGWLHFLHQQIQGSQFSCYLWACQQQGYDVWEGIVNGISTKADNLSKDLDKAFKRIPFTRTPYQIDQWLKSNTITIDRIVSDLNAFEMGVLKVDRNYGPACHAYNRQCDFYAVCHAESEDLAQAYGESFVVDSWKNFKVEW